MKQKLSERLMRGYLSRRADTLQEVIDTVPVFGKRYNDACDELEEIEDALEEKM